MNPKDHKEIERNMRTNIDRFFFGYGLLLLGKHYSSLTKDELRSMIQSNDMSKFITFDWKVKPSKQFLKWCGVE